MIKERVQKEGQGQWQERTSRDETASTKSSCPNGAMLAVPCSSGLITNFHHGTVGRVQ